MISVSKRFSLCWKYGILSSPFHLLQSLKPFQKCWQGRFSWFSGTYIGEACISQRCRFFQTEEKDCLSYSLCYISLKTKQNSKGSVQCKIGIYATGCMVSVCMYDFFFSSLSVFYCLLGRGDIYAVAKCCSFLLL